MQRLYLVIIFIYVIELKEYLFEKLIPQKIFCQVYPSKL
jgi:hypothetical protein